MGKRTSKTAGTARADTAGGSEKTYNGRRNYKNTGRKKAELSRVGSTEI